MHPFELLKFYRILPRKRSWLKLLGYTVLGCTLSHPPLSLAMLNLLMVCGIFMYGFAINDYFDFRIGGEKNFVGTFVEKRGEGKTFFLILLPLLLLTSFPLIPPPSLALLLSFFLIMTFHSAPPVRMKDRFGSLGYLLPPLGLTLTTLQALLLHHPIPTHHLLLLPLVFLAACQDEMLGLLLRKKEIKNRKKIERVALWLSLPLFLLSLLFLPFSPLFLTTTLFSLLKGEGLRRIARRGFRLKEDPLWRKMKPLGLSLSTYHLGAYALFGLLGLF